MELLATLLIIPAFVYTAILIEQYRIMRMVRLGSQHEFQLLQSEQRRQQQQQHALQKARRDALLAALSEWTIKAVCLFMLLGILAFLILCDLGYL
jgi:hypothetical protein